jgi:hypothetical protein
MVAASATAILNDINLSASNSHCPRRDAKFDANPAKRQGLPPVYPRIFNRVR